jgi:DNA-binding beta-propeller fold protein YncE
LLYAVRPDSVNGDVLLAIDPATYGTVHSISLPVGTRPAVLAADPAGGSLYLLSVGTDTLLALSVFDATSLAPRGILPLGERCPTDFDCNGAAIAVDLTLGRIDVVVPSVFTALSPPPSPRWSFDRLP